MKEREPKAPKYFRIEDASGNEIICTPEDTVCYLHDEDKYDHIFYISDVDAETGEMAGLYIFRWDLPVGKFDEISEFMYHNDYDVNPQEPTEADIEAFNERYQELPQKELTERQERFVDYLGYLLLHGHITTEEFSNGKGDLYI